MTAYRRGPRPVSIALHRQQAHWAPETLLAEVQEHWAQAVGEVIAAQARPTAERAGVVTVSCAASVWAQELDLMAPVLIERLNATLGRGAVARLRCVSVPVREAGSGW